MLIVFWSPVHGQTGTTSNLAAIATELALKYRFKILLMHNEYKKSSLDEVFLSKESIKESLNNTFDLGIDALGRYLKYNKLTEEGIKNYTTALLKDKLELLQGTCKTSKKDFYNMFSEIEDNLFYNVKKYYDFIISDATAGNVYSQELLKKADLIIVNLNQNIRIISRFFKSDFYKKYSKKSVFILGNYNEFSKFNIKNLRRKYFTKNKNKKGFFKKNEYYSLANIRYSIDFSDAINQGNIINFFLKNNLIDKTHYNFKFFQSVEESVEMILETLEIDLQVNKIGRGL